MNATEFSYFYDRYEEVFDNEKENVEYVDALDLLSFYRLLSPTKCPMAITWFNDDIEAFHATWHFKDGI